MCNSPACCPCLQALLAETKALREALEKREQPEKPAKRDPAERIGPSLPKKGRS